MPEKYAVSVLFVLMRFCERFGLDPFTLDAWPAGRKALAVEYESIREEQECR